MSLMLPSDSLLGRGAYTLAEVARYTRLSPMRVRSWFRGRSDGLGRGALVRGDLPVVGKDFAASFLDLVDVFVAGQFRNQGVSMRAVRAAYALLGERLDTPHPFCHHRLYTDGRDVFLYAAGELGDATLSEVVSRQQFFLHVRESLTQIVYCTESQIARQWKIADGVIIDPTVSKGKPVVVSTGVTTFVLANQYFANGRDGTLVADLFNTTEVDVLNAVDFEETFGGRRAA